MTLVWLALILTVIVFALVYIAWDIRTTFVKAYRYSMVDGARRARRSDDSAWAEFRAEASDRRRELEQALRTDDGIGRLAELMEAYTPEPVSTSRLRSVA